MRLSNQTKKALEVHEQINRVMKVMIDANRSEVRHHVDILELFGPVSNLTQRAQKKWNLRATDVGINFKESAEKIKIEVRKFDPTMILITIPPDLVESEAAKFYDTTKDLFQ